MEITPELFAIPDQGNYILYAPLEGCVLRVNPSTLGLIQRIKKGIPTDKQDLHALESLKKSGILRHKHRREEARPQENPEFAPTSVTLMPTFNCSLRCVYCYSRGGEDVGKSMELDVATAAIDLIVRNTIRLKSDSISLGFHGGGEPLLDPNMPFIKEVVGYFRTSALRNGLKNQVSAATNGVIGRKDLEWITTHFNHLNLSFDGPEDIQNSQRPMSSNKPSYDRIMDTVKYLEEKGFHYGIRATITSDSVARMSEILKFFNSISSCKSFHLEPLFECGRCRTTNKKSPSSEDFMKYSIETQELAKELGIDCYYSGSRLGGVSSRFCGAAGNNFFITPDGNVTTCLEVSREPDRGAEVFFIGAYDPESSGFSFDQSKIDYLRSRTVENLPHCTDCFAKYNCSGDCLTKTYQESGNLFDTADNSRCSVNRGLLKHKIKQILTSE
jgi:uncharacterized protein